MFNLKLYLHPRGTVLIFPSAVRCIVLLFYMTTLNLEAVKNNF